MQSVSDSLSPDRVTPLQRQRAFAVSLGFGLFMTLVTAYLFISASTSLTSAADVRVLSLAMTVASFVSAWLSWSGRSTWGIGLILASLSASVLAVSLVIADLSIPISTVTIVIAFGLGSLTLTKRAAAFANGAAVLVSALAIAIDLFAPFARQANARPTATWIITGLMIALYAALISRQFSTYPLRTKLTIALLATSFIPLAGVTLINDYTLRSSLTEDTNQSLLSAASQTVGELDSLIQGNLTTVATQARLPQIVEYLTASPSQRAAKKSTLLAMFSVFTQNNPTYISSVALLDETGNDILDTYPSDIGVNKADRDYFIAPIQTGEAYVSEVEFSQTAGDASLYFSAPVQDDLGQPIGVFRVRYKASILQDLITSNNGLVGPGSFAILLNQDHFRLAQGSNPTLVFKSIVPLDAATVTRLQNALRLPPGLPSQLATDLPELEAGLKNLNTQSFFTAETHSAGEGEEQVTAASLNTRPWLVIYAVDQKEFLAPIQTQARRNILFFVGISLLIVGSGWLVSNLLTSPLLRLTQTAEQVASGNLQVKADIPRGDEVGSLADSFNRMTSRLRELIDSLEERVAQRTRGLELAADVGRAVSQVRSLDEMLTDATERIRSRFELYYVQVYLVNDARTELRLQSGTGEAGRQLLSRQHRLPLEASSINGRAAQEQQTVIVADTADSPNFRPNPLLPKTRSEMAIPLLAGETVVGVLDLQSEQPNTLNQETAPAFESLAGQLAVAIQNARLLEQAQQARQEVEKQARRLTRQGWQDYLDALHTPETLGFIFEGQQLTPTDQTPAPEPGLQSIEQPITLGGEVIGRLQVETNPASGTSQAEEVLSLVAAQLAQHLESLRLLQNAERYRAQAEEAALRLTAQGWQEYFDRRKQAPSAYFYDRRQVKPAPAELPQPAALSLPLQVRDLPLGKIQLLDIDPADSESREIAQTIAERLSEHLESLRLLEETRQGQIELSRRAAQLAAVAEVSSTSSRELDVEKMLGLVVQLTQRKFNLYHAHVFTFNETASRLEIVACGWKQGDEHEGTHGTTTIPLDAEQSLVARAARSRAPVLVNDVRSDLGWLPNPLLPETAAELAVPLLIGDQLLGVLDVQADHQDAFSQEDVNIQTTLAAQVATALQNAHSFSRAQRQAERESLLNAISQKIQSATSVEAVLQIAARELGQALGAPRAIAQLSLKK